MGGTGEGREARVVRLLRHQRIEVERGKASIAVASKDKLAALIDALVGAAKAGELDGLMAASGKPVSAAKNRKAA